jgi:hypothetical protein
MQPLVLRIAQQGKGTKQCDKSIVKPENCTRAPEQSMPLPVRDMKRIVRRQERREKITD